MLLIRYAYAQAVLFYHNIAGVKGGNVRRRRDTREQGGVDILFSCEIQEAGGSAPPPTSRAGEKPVAWQRLVCPKGGITMLTLCAECGKTLALQICHSFAGFYLGYWCPQCGPYGHYSGYYATWEEAEKALLAWRE